MKNLAIILVFMLTLHLASVDAINCYVCKANTDNCFTGSTSDCSSCFIVKATGSINGTSGSNVQKTCSKEVGSGCIYETRDGLSASACYCSKDLCDSGSLIN